MNRRKRLLNKLQALFVIPLVLVVLTKPTNSVQAETNYKTLAYVAGSIPTDAPLNKLNYLVWESAMIANSSDPKLVDYNHKSFSQLDDVVAASHTAGCKVLLGLYGTSELDSLTADTTLRRTLIFNLYNLAATKKVDGISLDWESQAYPERQDIFIKELYDLIHPRGMLLAAAGCFRTNSTHAPNDQFNFSVTASQYLNIIELMVYDMWGFGTANYPYHSLYADTVTVIQDWLSHGYPANKILAGIPAYGRDANTLWTYYNAIIDSIKPLDSQDYANISLFDGRMVEGGTLWWGGLDLTKKKVDYFKSQNLAGAFVYCLNTDKLNDPKSIIDVVYKQLNIASPAPTPIPTPTPTPKPNENQHPPNNNGNSSNQTVSNMPPQDPFGRLTWFVGKAKELGWTDRQIDYMFPLLLKFILRKND